MSAGSNRFWESHSRSVTLGLSWICLGQVGICWYPTDKVRMTPPFAAPGFGGTASAGEKASGRHGRRYGGLLGAHGP